MNKFIKNKAIIYAEINNMFNEQKKENKLNFTYKEGLIAGYLKGVEEAFKLFGIKDLNIDFFYLTNEDRMLVNEDNLPNMTDEEYSQWYNNSKIINGVRVGLPFILKPINDDN